MQFRDTLKPSIDEDDDEDDDDEEEDPESEQDHQHPEDAIVFEPPKHELPERAEKVGPDSAIVGNEFVDNFRLGGWFRRIPRSDPKDFRKPHAGSRRPIDIHPHLWAGVGQYPQNRKLECRLCESRGEEPPPLPDGMFERLTEEQKTSVTEALMRSQDIKNGEIEVVMPSAAAMEKCPIDVPADPMAAEAGGLDPDAVWPEGAEARSSLESWCEAEGVPVPSQPQIGHRQRQGAVRPGFV